MDVKKTRVVVIGTGAWGMTIAKVLTENGHEVVVWGRSNQIVTQINQTHVSHRLPGVLLPQKLRASNDIAAIIKASDINIIAVPSAYLKVLEADIKLIQKPVVLLSKGLMDGIESPFISDYLTGRLQVTKLAVLSGPNLALEIAQKKPAASVVASEDATLAQDIQKLLSNAYFRVYRSNDIRGVELGGILKNIFAIAAGLIDGYQWGDNAKAALVSRALQEIQLVGSFYGAKKETFVGLSGLGDLMATANSDQSRNWQFGYAYAKAAEKNISSVIAKDKVVEGVRTCELIYPNIIKNNLDTPIIKGIYRCLFKDESPDSIVEALMTRDLKTESCA